MQLEIKGNNELAIIGNIKSIDDSNEIKAAISSLQQKGVKSITMKVQDSFSMTSTVIGHLMKLINIDKIIVTLSVGDQRLYQLLEELNLIQMFNVRLIVK